MPRTRRDARKKVKCIDGGFKLNRVVAVLLWISYATPTLRTLWVPPTTGWLATTALPYSLWRSHTTTPISTNDSSSGWLATQTEAAEMKLIPQTTVRERPRETVTLFVTFSPADTLLVSVWAGTVAGQTPATDRSHTYFEVQVLSPVGRVL